MLVGIVLLLSIGMVWWNERNIRIWASFELWRATPLPEFDASKAARLSAERRTELERELFTEVYMWNTQSRRYHGPNGGLERELRWQSMANEGYELAHLALKVFEPSTGRMHNPVPAFKRLNELAQQGDAGAMCLIVRIATYLPRRAHVDWSPQDDLKNVWLLKGAEIGHPQCLIDLGGRLISGSDGQPLDVERGIGMIFKAFESGYVHWVGSLSLFAANRGLNTTANRQAVYCWDFHASKYSFHDPDLTLRVYARSEAHQEQREALLQELNQFRQWSPSIEECIELTKLGQGE